MQHVKGQLLLAIMAIGLAAGNCPSIASPSMITDRVPPRAYASTPPPTPMWVAIASDAPAASNAASAACLEPPVTRQFHRELAPVLPTLPLTDPRLEEL